MTKKRSSSNNSNTDIIPVVQKQELTVIQGQQDHVVMRDNAVKVLMAQVETGLETQIQNLQNHIKHLHQELGAKQKLVEDTIAAYFADDNNRPPKFVRALTTICDELAHLDTIPVTAETRASWCSIDHTDTEWRLRVGNATYSRVTFTHPVTLPAQVESLHKQIQEHSANIQTLQQICNRVSWQLANLPKVQRQIEASIAATDLSTSETGTALLQRLSAVVQRFIPDDNIRAFLQ